MDTHREKDREKDQPELKQVPFPSNDAFLVIIIQANLAMFRYAHNYRF